MILYDPEFDEEYEDPRDLPSEDESINKYLDDWIDEYLDQELENDEIQGIYDDYLSEVLDLASPETVKQIHELLKNDTKIRNLTGDKLMEYIGERTIYGIY